MSNVASLYRPLCNAKEKQEVTESLSKNLLRFLRRLRPHLHQGIDKRVTRNRKEHANSRISPSVIVVEDIDCVEVVTTTSVLAYAALVESVRIDEVVPRTGTCEIWCQVFTARLSLGRVEDSEL